RLQFMEELVQGHVLTAGDGTAAALDSPQFGGGRFFFRELCRKSEVCAQRFADQLRTGPVLGLADCLDTLRHLPEKGDGKKGSGFAFAHRVNGYKRPEQTASVAMSFMSRRKQLVGRNPAGAEA